MPGWRTRGSGAATTRGRSLAMSRQCDDCDRPATEHFCVHSRRRPFANDRLGGRPHADDVVARTAAIARATFGWMRVESCLFALAVASHGACSYPALPLLEDFAPRSSRSSRRRRPGPRSGPGTAWVEASDVTTKSVRGATVAVDP